LVDSHTLIPELSRNPRAVSNPLSLRSTWGWRMKPITCSPGGGTDAPDCPPRRQGLPRSRPATESRSWHTTLGIAPAPTLLPPRPGPLRPTRPHHDQPGTAV